MKTEEIVKALLLTPSRSKRTLLNTAANEIKRLTDRCARYAEEIADVGIMLDQMAILCEAEDNVAQWRGFKVKRLRERIEDNGGVDNDGK